MEASPSLQEGDLRGEGDEGNKRLLDADDRGCSLEASVFVPAGVAKRRRRDDGDGECDLSSSSTGATTATTICPPFCQHQPEPNVQQLKNSVRFTLLFDVDRIPFPSLLFFTHDSAAACFPVHGVLGRRLLFTARRGGWFAVDGRGFGC